MITFMLDGNKASMSNTQKHIVNESIDYWYSRTLRQQIPSCRQSKD